jgi:hypothetical protein
MKCDELDVAKKKLQKSGRSPSELTVEGWLRM